MEWMLSIPVTLRMLANFNGMGAVNYKQFRALSVCFVDQIMLSIGMNAVNSLLWLPNFVEWWLGGGGGGGVPQP